jgi:glutamate dehydrogenase/leucine dehydrogenase
MDLWKASPDALIAAMRDEGLKRGYLVTYPDTSELRASHAVLEPLREAVAADDRDFHRHEGCFFEIGRESGHLLTAFVHMTRRGQAAGGVRFWSYDTVEDMVRDGLRLARGMGHKCALAGLWWGGGKGVVARRSGEDHRNPEIRRQVYQDYGRFMTGLRGCYVTAEDVGTTTEDMSQIFSTTRFTTCIPQEVGGSGNPSILTAAGVVVAMEAALDHLGMGSLEGKSVAMQGLGNVSIFMIGDLLQRGVKHIVGSDIDGLAIERIQSRYRDAPLDLRLVDRHDTSILAEPCDIVAPNAVGAILNPHTIPTIQAKIICGGANNQLHDSDRDSDVLRQKGVLYVPDFLANRMGIVNCANEQYGIIDGDPAITAHLDRDNPSGIFQRSQEVFRRAEESGRTTAQEAESLADELALQLHPMCGHRGQLIINHLVNAGWDRGEI